MIEIQNNECMGCESCKMMCPKNAISFNFKFGFKYPLIDSSKCIDCNLCKKVCPAICNEENNSSYQLYASWIKEDEIRKQSTSGGICYALSKFIIEQGGYVAGVVWDENYRNAKYEVVNTIDGLNAISQTKYFQPNMNNVFSKIQELLDKNQTVLFIGTSCTNSGLRLFLRKNYKNLYCCDFICRGYTSQMYHKKRVDYLEKKFHSKIIKIQYKNKDKGWNNFGTKFWFENGKSVYINRFNDPYELLFTKDDFNTRPSCYNCKFRKLPRNSDITVGDFWAIKNVPEKANYLGVSAVIISSTKGQFLFESIKEKLYSEKRDVNELVKGNYALLNQLKRNEGSEQFFEDLNNLSFEDFNKKYLPKRETRMKKYLRFIRNVFRCNIFVFIYYNFLCNKVSRKRNAFIFPVRGTKIELHKNSKLILNKNLYLNYPKHKFSNEQTYLKILNNGVFQINGVCTFAANNTIEINNDARFSTGKLETNYGTTIVCGNVIECGDDIGIGRNVTIYDNNFHSTGLNKNVKMKPLVIGDHVWICTGVTIAKGVKIDDGAICSINSTITRNVAARTMVSGNPAKEVMINVKW